MIHDQMLLSMYQQHPEIASSPDAQSFLKKKYGADVAEGFMKIGQVQQQAQQQFGQAFGGGGAAPPSSPSAASGQGQPAGGQAQPPASPQAGAAPQQVDPIEQKQRHIQSMEQFMASPGWSNLPPDKQKAATDIYNREQGELTRLTTLKQQNDLNARADQRDREFHADSEQDKAQARAIQAQTAAMMGQIHQETLALQAGNAQFMHQMATDKNEEAQHAHFQSAVGNLATQTTNIAKMLSAATPADPNTIRTLLAARNAQARALKTQADKSGIDYDPDQFKPLTTKTVKGYFSSTTSLDDAPEAGGDTSSGTPTGRAVKDKSGKVIGYTTDGKTMTPAP